MASRSRKPRSLNDSHYRLLQDLTTPRPSKASSPSIDQNPLPAFRLEEEDERSPPIVAESNRVLGDVDTGVPQFSAITDFGTSPGENRAKKVDMEGQCHGKVSSRNYDGFENGKAAGEHEFAGVSEKNEPVKVKIQGRRRLCKLSSQESTEVDDKPSYDKPKLFDITDFDSPLPTQTCEAIGSDIRDILNDLSSRLELLSVERRPPPKEKEAAQDRPILVKDQEISEGENIEAPEYASAESSFSVASDSFDVLSDVRKIVADKARSFKQTLNASFVRDDVDHTCQSVKHVVKPSAKITKEDKEKSGQDIIDVSDELVDKIHADDENYFILSGLKFTYKLPRKIAKMLYPHQVDGLKWLWSLHCKGKGGILGDDMGLGKTMQICGFLAGLFSSRLIKRALIVSPKTLLSHWLKELSAVGLSEKTREYFATCPRTRQYELQYVLQDKGILLTTYDIVRNNSKSLRGDFYFKDDELDEDNMTWDYMILDEGHLIKNPSTQRAKSLLEIPAAHRIVISGTPIQNNLKELWALFHFCCPELLGDKKEFKEKYEDPILRGNEKKASERDKRIGSAVAKALRERIQPYFLRRLKNEVFHEDDAIVSKLSKKNDMIVWLRLTSCQRRLYEAFLNSELVLSSFDGSPLAALTILKKICDHPLLLTKRAAEDVLEGMDSMVNPDDVDMAEKLATHIADIGDREGFQETHDGISCKTSFIISLLDNLIPEGHNVLIFSQTRKMLNLIQESLMSSGYKYLRIDGTTKASDRIKIVNDFQEGIGAPIFLLTSQVGGLGLTLTRADRVIVVDPAWNPSTDNQSVDRAYRIGQKKDVIVYRLMTCGTIEEKIYRKQIFKGGLFKTATEHKEQIRYFSQQDLKELFSLPKEGFDISPTQQQLNEEHDHLHRMDESLKSHIEFLETLGIAGVSHHSLLYSKTAPVQVAEEEAEVIRINSTAFVRNPSSAASRDRDVDGAAYAFNPKDVKFNRKSQTPGSGSSSNKGTESDIKDRISRLSRMLADKATIMRLPDKGERIEKQLAELNLELQKISMAQRAELEVIDLDDISGDFQKLNM